MGKLKKVISKILIIVLILVSACFSFACFGNYNRQCKITFIEEGYPDIEICVDRGETLTEIPEVHERVGYNVFWNTTDFSNITKDIVVYANVYAKRYKLTYVINRKSSNFKDNNVRIYNISDYQENLSSLEPNRLYYDVNTGEYFQVCIYDKVFNHFEPSHGSSYFYWWADSNELRTLNGQIYGDRFEDDIKWLYTENKSVTAIYIFAHA